MSLSLLLGLNCRQAKTISFTFFLLYLATCLAQDRHLTNAAELNSVCVQ